MISKMKRLWEKSCRRLLLCMDDKLWFSQTYSPSSMGA